MHYSWWVIALVALVVAGGAVVGLWRSKSAVESRAVALSFAMLALVALVFFFLTVIEIPVLPAVFAVACVVAPLATYVVVVIVHERKRPAVQASARKHPASKSMRAEKRPKVMPSPVPCEAEPEYEVEREPVHAIGREPEVEGETTFAFELEPEPMVEAEFEPEPELVTESEPELVTDPEPAIDLRTEPEPVFAPVPEPQLAPAPAPAQPTFDDFFSKATALKERGAHKVAARVFAESAAHVATGQDVRRARFEELACYVKAGQPDRARVLAEELRAKTGTMTRVERIKLDAVLRTL